MRIDDQNGGANALTAQTNGTSSAGRANTAGDGKTASSASGSDSVRISGFAGQLSKTLAAGSSSRAQRVSEISQAVRSGTYQVDGAAVGHAMVEQALAIGKGAGVS